MQKFRSVPLVAYKRRFPASSCLKALVPCLQLPKNCKNEYLVHALGEETAVQTIVGSIVWTCSQAQKAKKSGDERPRLRVP